MTALVWWLLVGTVVGTVLVLGLVVWVTVRRVRAAVADATATLQRFGPAVEKVERRVAVTRNELDRVGASLDELRRQREERAADRSGSRRGADR